HLHVRWIDRDGFDGHAQVARARRWSGQLKIDKRTLRRNRTCRPVTNGFHGAQLLTLSTFAATTISSDLLSAPTSSRLLRAGGYTARWDNLRRFGRRLPRHYPIE